MSTKAPGFSLGRKVPQFYKLFLLFEKKNMEDGKLLPGKFCDFERKIKYKALSYNTLYWQYIGSKWD